MAELYKSIRTKLEFHRRSGSVQVILVASPHSGDGKSTTASNLAISLAHAGRKTLLIDADLRRASLHHIFALERDMGLVQILKDNAPLESVVQPTLIQNLDFVSSGPEVDNPAELLASSRLNEFLNEARGTYDVVIIDSPPILAVTDPCVISSSVDGIVLIVRASTIKRADAEHTMELLRTLGIPVLGTVINGITREQAGYGYGYGQGYGYGYGYGYGGYVYGGDRGPARPLDGVPGNGVPGNGVGAASVPMELTRPSSDPEHGSNMPLPPANS